MKVNARTGEFQHIELFDKYALFTNARIDRSTVPKGWHCYDFRGSDDDPGELCYIEKSVTVNHAGSVLMPEKLEMPASGRLDVRDEIGFLDEGDMTLREFCEAHQLPYPEEKEQFHIRPRAYFIPRTPKKIHGWVPSAMSVWTSDAAEMSSGTHGGREGRRS